MAFKNEDVAGNRSNHLTVRELMRRRGEMDVGGNKKKKRDSGEVHLSGRRQYGSVSSAEAHDEHSGELFTG